MKPMLASAVSELPEGPGWAFEFKWDGVRALFDIDERGYRLISRNGNEVTAAYPELAGLAERAGDALVDGEIVAFAGGRPSFERLQRRMHVRSAAQARRLAGEIPVTFMAFDLLRRYGVDLTGRPYIERRATLERWLDERGDWTISPFFDDGPATLTAAREHGLEGVVAKRLAAAYRAGVRSPDWVKLRFSHTGDFLVVGWEAATAAPDALSSLVLACAADGGLTFAGKVGSGLDGRTARALRARLTERADCPLGEVPPPSPGRVVRWCEPDLVVEVEFAAWTDERRLRHPVFCRLREDKDPDEAVGDA
jgi:bifunctional non-homologous end joining protein LigD